MKILIIILSSLIFLVSCTEEPQNFTQFTSPNGGTFAIRLPDQVQVTENSFVYQIKIENVQNEYAESKRYIFERMNFHPFTPVFAKHQLEFLHFEYFNLPLKQREEAFKYLAEWDKKIKINPTLFKVTTNLIFAICKKQPIPDDKLVTTIFSRLNKDDDFIQIYDDLLPTKNTLTPTIAYQEVC